MCMYQRITVASKLPALYFTFALPSLKAYYSSHSNLHKNEAISYILFQPMLTSYHFICTRLTYFKQVLLLCTVCIGMYTHIAIFLKEIESHKCSLPSIYFWRGAYMYLLTYICIKSFFLSIILLL